MHQRMVRPYFYPSFIFNWFGAGREMDKCVKVLHDFTWTAIANRKAKADAAGGVEKLLAQETSEGIICSNIIRNFAQGADEWPS